VIVASFTAKGKNIGLYIQKKKKVSGIISNGPIVRLKL